MVIWGLAKHSQSISKSLGGIHRKVGRYKVPHENDKVSVPGRIFIPQGHRLHLSRHLEDLGPQRGYCVTSYFMFPLPHVSVSFAITTNKIFTSLVGIFQHSYYCPVMQKMHIRIRVLDCPARLRVIWAWTSYHCILHLSLLPSGSLKQLSLSYPLFTTVYWAWYGG